MIDYPPAGWYPDYEGTLRWWDGSGWTETLESSHTSTVTEPVPPAEQPHRHRSDAKAVKARTNATRPWHRKKRWIGSPDKGRGSRGDKLGTSSNPIAVGETIELAGTRYTVESARTAPTVRGEFFVEKAGGIYVIVELTIENTKDETKTFMSEAARLIGGNDKKYSTDNNGTVAAIAKDGEPLMFEDAQPDVPKTGVLVYDVPRTAVAGGLLQVSDLSGRGDAYIDLALT